MAEDTAVETKFCKNCKRDISAVNFVMHEMHCMRNITLCKHCNEPVPKGEIDQHFEDTHAKIACQKCGIQVEKNDLEKHEEEECSKRSMKCLYCELEMPKADLDTHLGYCGTRTEECVKCGQFIMKKDELKHDESSCTYPTPKPSTNNTNRNPSNGFLVNSNLDGNSVLLPDEIYHSEPNFDPFMFDEMHRLLNTEDITGAAGGTSNPIVNDTRRDKMKFTKSKTNKKSEVNRQRERTNQSRSEPTGNVSQEEQDRLLAMHLDQDLNEESNLQNMIREFDKPSLVQRGGNSSYMMDRNVTDSYDIEPDFTDISFLPCEFCGEAIPIDDLVNHQSHCTDDPLSSLMPQINNREDPEWSSGRLAEESNQQENNIDNRFRSQDSTRQQPSVINNLDYGVVQNVWAGDSENVDVHGYDSGNFMLPCEFCDELFPQDVLVQHQAVCEPGNSMTPRVTSPAVNRQPKKQNVEPSSNSHSDRNQSYPNFDEILQNHRISNSQASSRASRDEPPSKQLRETLHKYGVDMKEPKLPQSRRYSSTHDSDEENHSTPRRQPKPKDSSKRTKSTLDNLLHDQPTPAFDFLGHLSSSSQRKQSKDNINVSRQSHTSGYTPSAARGDTKSNKSMVSNRNIRQDQEVVGSFVDPRTNRNTTRPQASIAGSSSRTRTQAGATPSRPTASRSTVIGASGNTPSRSAGLDIGGNNRRTRTTPFDYGTSRNQKPYSRRNPDQL